jgi:ribosomal protein S18 acetylase RimI-like enzyme
MATLTEWRIRRAARRDREPILRLWEAVGLSAADEDEWQALTDGPAAKLIVSERDDEILGTAVLAFDGWRAYIYHVAVAPSVRGEGLGRALMAEAEDYLRAQGARRVYVQVGEGNTAGVALCTSTGFFPEGDLAMVKELRG